MSITSKSPRTVLLVAHEAARRSLPTYAHRFAPKKFTQHQLFACLVLKVHQGQDYRGVCVLLADSPDLRQAIGLKEVPHYTTLQKACARLIQSARVRDQLGRQHQVQIFGRPRHGPQIRADQGAHARVGQMQLFEVQRPLNNLKKPRRREEELRRERLDFKALFFWSSSRLRAFAASRLRGFAAQSGLFRGLTSQFSKK